MLRRDPYVSTLNLNDTHNYDILSLPTVAELAGVIRMFEKVTPADKSQWYGDLNKVKTVTEVDAVARIIQWQEDLFSIHQRPSSSSPSSFGSGSGSGTGTTSTSRSASPHSSDKQSSARTPLPLMSPIPIQTPTAIAQPVALDPPFIAILPFHVCRPNYIVSVREEFLYSLYLFRKYLDNHRTWFSEPDGSHPAIYAVSRVYTSPDHRPRSLFLHQLFGVIVRVADTFQTRDVHVVMNKVDVYQSGLYAISTIENWRCPRNRQATESDLDSYVKLRISTAALNAYYKQLSSIDSVIVDALIRINDHGKLGQRGFKLKLQRVRGQKFVASSRSIDPSLLAHAIRLADDYPGGPPLDDAKIADAVKFVMADIHTSGFSLEQPMKFVDRYDLQFHMLREPATACSSDECNYRVFWRQVRSISDRGYKVRMISWFLWITLALSIVIPFSYCGLRFATKSNGEELSWDDLLSTSISIVTLCVGAAVTCLLNTRYKGEALFDVLSNLRQIDTQEEFTARGADRQSSDIIEVLRQSNNSPGFFGGGPNTSYLRGTFPNAGLDSQNPMPFANLEAIGYGLYEDSRGYLYMVDPWNSLFETSVVDTQHQVTLYQEGGPGNNSYIIVDDLDTPNEGQTQKSRRSSDAQSNRNRLSMDRMNSRGNRSARTIGGDESVLSNETANSSLRRTRTRIEALAAGQNNSTAIGADLFKVMTLYCRYIETESVEQVVDQSAASGDSWISFHNDREHMPDTPAADRSHQAQNNERDRQEHPKREQKATLPSTDTGCLRVRIRSSGEEKKISRVLPHRARKRAIGLLFRTVQNDRSWCKIRNSDLLRMDVGTVNVLENFVDDSDQDAASSDDSVRINLMRP